MLVALWATLWILARRLPPGPMRDLTAVLPASATMVRRLRRHPAVPKRAKLVLLVALLWLLSPIDLVPEVLPLIGALDDVVVIVLALRYAARSVDRAVLHEAWPERPELLDRLLGQG